MRSGLAMTRALVPVLSVVVDAECFSAFRTDPNGMAWHLTILAILHGTPIWASLYRSSKYNILRDTTEHR